MPRRKSARSAKQMEVAQGLIEALEAGDVPPWIAPWAADAGLPASLATGQVYRGINVLSLWLAMRARGHTQRWWCTFRQALKLGGHVKRGERGTPVVFWRQVDETHETPSRWVSGYAVVFNIDQCAGLAMPTPPERPVGKLDQWVRGTGLEVREAGGHAFYDFEADRVQVPPREAFEDLGGYYATLLHELVHATGHRTRLARKFGGAFADDNYAKEELVAEIGSAFLCAEFQIPGRLQHAAYLDHWVRVLRAEPRALLTIASTAQRAVDWLHKKTLRPSQPLSTPAPTSA